MKKEKVMKQYNVGVIGLGNRGHALLSSMMACPECKVVALSDLYEDRIEKASKLVEERQKDAPKAYLNWKDLVDSPKVEIVMIICDWEMHIPMSIYAMEKGKIVEQGTHSELLKKEGFYANLYNSQFAIA